MISPFELESEVRSYCRRIPSVFAKAKNAVLWDEEGHVHLDLLSGCGALNYGHNHPVIQKAVLDYLASDGIALAMDLHTAPKRAFLNELNQTILAPRHLDYKVQFTGPTGTNAIEAALKLARKVTRRASVVGFSNGFHGMTLGALAASDNRLAREGAGVPLQHILRLPFEGFAGAGISELEHFGRLVESGTSGVDRPAAFLVETVQGEGGLNVASCEWLQALSALAKRLDALLIVDDIQAGCGRTGNFFSFERAGIQPDIVCLAKSIGGLGLPLAIVLMKPEFDLWRPAEHNGTFRANALALIAGTSALELWRDPSFAVEIGKRAKRIGAFIGDLCAEYPAQLNPKGIGLMQGIAFKQSGLAAKAAQAAIGRRLLIECCGPVDELLKIMPPLTIELEILEKALDRLRLAIDQALETTTASYRLAAQ
jgi:diaminobutyrate-2-oxoglutarate transaminase